MSMQVREVWRPQNEPTMPQTMPPILFKRSGASGGYQAVEPDASNCVPQSPWSLPFAVPEASYPVDENTEHFYPLAGGVSDTALASPRKNVGKAGVSASKLTRSERDKKRREEETSTQKQDRKNKRKIREVAHFQKLNISDADRCATRNKRDAHHRKNMTAADKVIFKKKRCLQYAARQSKKSGEGGESEENFGASEEAVGTSMASTSPTSLSLQSGYHSVPAWDASGHSELNHL